MPNVQLSPPAYSGFLRRAEAVGLTVDEYLNQIGSADDGFVLTPELREAEDENFSHIFTPQVLAELDAIVSRIDSGAKTYTLEEIDVDLTGHKAAWLASRQS